MDDLNIFLNILVFCVYLVGCCAAGHVVLKILFLAKGKSSSEKFLNEHVLEFSIGIVILSVVWLAFALVGMLNLYAVWTVLLLLMVLFLFMQMHYKVVNDGAVSTISWGNFTQTVAIRLVGILVVGVVLWLGILAYFRPPFGDADAFYMTYPKIISAIGKLEPMPGWYHDFSSIGLGGELHYAAIMSVGDPRVAKLFAWATAIAALLLTKEIVKEVGGGKVAQLFSVCMLLTSSTFTDYITDGKTDIYAVVLALAAVLTTLRIRSLSSLWARIITSGLLTGFSVVAKFSFLVAFLPALVTLIYFRTELLDSQHDVALKFRIKRQLQYMAVFGVSFLIALIPHLIKNQLTFDNALVPFFGMKNNWANQSNWYSQIDTLWIIATFPFALVYGLYPLMGGNISFLCVAALPLLLVLYRGKRYTDSALFQLSIAGCIGLCCWFLIKGSIFAPRYFLAPLIMLFPILAIAVERLWISESNPKLISYTYALLTIFALVIVPFVPPAGVWTTLPSQVFNYLKKGAPDCGLAISSYCTGLNTINANAEYGERVLLAGYYSYYLRSDLLQCINSPQDLNMLKKSDGNNVWSDLYNNGFTYVAIQKATHRYLLDELDLELPPSWMVVTKDYENSDMPIFHIKALDGRTPSVRCIQTKTNSWNLAGY